MERHHDRAGLGGGSAGHRPHGGRYRAGAGAGHPPRQLGIPFHHRQRPQRH